MKLSKRFVIPAVAAVGLLAAGSTAALAANSSQPGTLAQKIATTFHLDANKVQGVIDQNHADAQANREQKYEDRLAQAVTNGMLTPAQKQSILTEHNKLQSELAGIKNLSDTDRKALMQKIRAEVQAWSKQNNLSAVWLGPGMGRGFGGGMHMHTMGAQTNQGS